jgi:hypothetical protein
MFRHTAAIDGYSCNTPTPCDGSSGRDDAKVNIVEPPLFADRKGADIMRV